MKDIPRFIVYQAFVNPFIDIYQTPEEAFTLRTAAEQHWPILKHGNFCTLLHFCFLPFVGLLVFFLLFYEKHSGRISAKDWED